MRDRFYPAHASMRSQFHRRARVFAADLAGEARYHGKRLVVVEVNDGALEVRFDEGGQLVGP